MKLFSVFAVRVLFETIFKCDLKFHDSRHKFFEIILPNVTMTLRNGVSDGICGGSILLDVGRDLFIS